MNQTTITTRIFRFRPGDPDSGHFDETKIPVDKTTTVLDVLARLHRADPSLMYRHSCHHGSCGTCTCRINGREALACMTRVLDLDTAVVTVEPLRKLSAVGDLVVDPVDFFREYPSVWQTLRSSEPRPGSTAIEGPLGFTRLENCIECGACVSACPVEDFLGPAVLAGLNRERLNQPQNETGLLELARGDRGVWRCERALECSRVCPTGVYPARHIQELRSKLREIERGK
jgi:succinate dehydrogenase / fumarate reductase iron-sulfur subunit